MQIFYEENGKRYSVIDKKIFDFLQPKRGDNIFFEIILFDKLKEVLKSLNEELKIEEEIYFSIENENNLYILVLASNALTYYISKGDEKEAKEEIIEFIGFLIGYIKGYKIGLRYA